MVDQPHSGEEEQGGDYERSDPEVPSRALPTNPDPKESEDQHHYAQRAIASTREWFRERLWPRIKATAPSPNFWTALATVVIAAATIVYTLYAHKQWTAMNDTLSEIQKQTPEIQKQAKAAQDQLAQAKADSVASSEATAKQMAALQAQITIAQNGTKALQGQLTEARRSADIAARQLELTDRPWIKIETVMPRGNGPVIPALSFQDINVTGPPAIKQQAYLNFEVHGSNVGHSTALSIKVIPELYLAQWKDGYSGKVEQEETRFCTQVEKDNKNWGATAQAVFQGETFDSYGGVSGAITGDAMNFFSDLPGEPYILPVLIGCVDYQFQASSAHHHVRFVYEVFHASDPRTRFFLAGQGTKADDLNLIRNASDDYAD